MVVIIKCARPSQSSALIRNNRVRALYVEMTRRESRSGAAAALTTTMLWLSGAAVLLSLLIVAVAADPFGSTAAGGGGGGNAEARGFSSSNIVNANGVISGASFGYNSVSGGGGVGIQIGANDVRCPRMCSCTGPTVDCSHRGLVQVPRRIPADTEKL